MFDKDLFLSLCEKYNVELSDTLTRPMMKVGSQLCDITNHDINRVFAPKKTYFSDYGKRFRGYRTKRVDGNRSTAR